MKERERMREQESFFLANVKTLVKKGGRPIVVEQQRGGGDVRLVRV